MKNIFSNLSEKMFDNIGEKIKTIAKVLCWIGIIVSAIFFIISILYGISSFFSSFKALRYVFGRAGGGAMSYIGRGFITFLGSVVIGAIGFIIGAFLSWIGSVRLYGYGELIERTAEVAENTKPAPAQKSEFFTPAADITEFSTPENQ